VTDGTHDDEASNKKLFHCSFCGKPDRDVEQMIAGPDVFICNVCVEICRDIIGESRMRNKND